MRLRSTRPALSLLWLLSVLAVRPSFAAGQGAAPDEKADKKQADKKEADKGPDKSADKNPAPEKTNESPRRSYNKARAAFESGDFEKAAAGFLAARDSADADDEVRYRAAFNLALTYARQADALLGNKDKLQDALGALQQSAAWFRDAVHGHPDDLDARHNLELVLRRMQQLADELNKGQNTLEARLARVIADQRTLRDRVRALISRVNQAGAATEPLSFQSEFEDQATFQRTLLSDAGAILDLAGEQRDHLSQRADKDLTDEERGKLVQLQNLEHYLNLARGSMADVARLLRRLQGDRAHRQADEAVTLLKRAQEQLQDPVTVLKGLTADQGTLYGQTVALDQIRQGSMQLPLQGDHKAEKPTAPAWLTSEFLSEQQKQLSPRTSELLARLRAGVEHLSQKPASPNPANQSQPQQPPQSPEDEVKERRILEAAKQAIPLMEQALTAMDQSTSALGSNELPPAAKAQTDVLLNLFKALERFSGIRDLIELAYADETHAVELLTQDPKSPVAKLSTQERTQLLKEAIAHNKDRLARLKDLFADELQSLQGKAAQADPKKQEDKEKLEAEKQRYELAEQKRQQAEAAINRLAGAMNGVNQGPGRGRELLPAAEEGRKHLEELRRLFFSIIEHLKELLRNQTETHDSTGSAQASKDEDEKRRKLGPLVQAQQGHAELGKALAEALAAQADQAQNAQDPQAKQAQKPLSDAAEEVRKAQSTMEQAAQTLRDDQQAQQSLDLEAPMDKQKQAMEHLEAAIHILEPPQNKQQNQDQKQQQQNQDQQISQEQAARRLQAIREREAERQRKKQQQAQPEPVEKDW